jgi:hypothetical protein
MAVPFSYRVTVWIREYAGLNIQLSNTTNLSDFDRHFSSMLDNVLIEMLAVNYKQQQKTPSHIQTFLQISSSLTNSHKQHSTVAGYGLVDVSYTCSSVQQTECERVAVPGNRRSALSPRFRESSK